MGILPAIAANIIKEFASKRKVDIGMFLVVHTFGRDLKKNYHIHLSTTLTGISWNKKALKKIYIDHKPLKKQWRYLITDLLRNEYKSGRLDVPKSWNIREYRDFNSILNRNYKKQWVVYLNKSNDDHKYNVEYFGKYLKRPPIGEARIEFYDGKNVVFNYLDHSVKKMQRMKMSVVTFIKRLICHIPDKYFRSIRYYGILSNRRIGEDLPVFNELLSGCEINNIRKENKRNLKKQKKITFRSMFIKAFGVDPIECPDCKIEMVLCWVYYSNKLLLRSMHEKIARGLP